MRHRSLSLAAGLGLACLLASLGLPQAGHAGSAGANTQLEVKNDGISLVFSAASNHNVLATQIRVVGPDDYAFERRAEAPMVEWVAPADLADGRYQWEAWAITVAPGKAQIEDSAILIERAYADEHKQVQKTSGMLRVRGGVLESVPEPGDELASAPERLFGALLTHLVPAAAAADLTAESTNPRLNYDDTATTGTDWYTLGNEFYFRIRDFGEGTPFQIDKGAPTHTMRINQFGRVGLGTNTPSRSGLHVSGTSTHPSIRLEDTGVSQSWWMANTNSSRFELHSRSHYDGGCSGLCRSVPFTIESTSSDLSAESQDGALYIDRVGRVGLGTAAPASALHVQRSDSSTGVLVEETSSTTAARELFKLSNNGGPFFIFENTDIGESYSFAMGATGHFILSHQQTSGVQMRLTPAGNLTIAGSLNEGSSRTIKDGITPVDPATVLAKLDALPVSEWRYKDAPGSRHVGPMAEDFHATFGLGPDERHIAPRDLAGVALAAAKALKDKTSRLESENAALKANAAARDALIASLEERLARMEKIIPD